MGKTTAIKRLADIRTSIWGANRDLQTCVLESDANFFLDNAQLFLEVEQLRLMPDMTSKFTLAAFSPGASIDSKCKLKKSCTDGENIDFYFRPFMLSEAQKLVGTDCIIPEEEFISCYYLTNGCPRYIDSYIRTKNLRINLFKQCS